VGILGHGLHHVQKILGQFAPLPPLLGDGLDIGVGGQVAGQEKEENALRQGFLAARPLGQFFPQLGNGEPAESDSFKLVQERSVPDHAQDVPDSAVGLRN
jgi:hypothetical protein